MFMLTQVADLMLAGNYRRPMDRLALVLICREQAAQDAGRWEVAYTLSLFPNPPHTVFQSRATPYNPRMRIRDLPAGTRPMQAFPLQKQATKGETSQNRHAAGSPKLRSRTSERGLLQATVPEAWPCSSQAAAALKSSPEPRPTRAVRPPRLTFRR